MYAAEDPVCIRGRNWTWLCAVQPTLARASLQSATTLLAIPRVLGVGDTAKDYGLLTGGTCVTLGPRHRTETTHSCRTWLSDVLEQGEGVASG